MDAACELCDETPARHLRTTLVYGGDPEPEVADWQVCDRCRAELLAEIRVRLGPHVTLDLTGESLT